MTKKNYKGFYNIVKNETKKEASIFIYGVIGGFDYDTYSEINTSDKFVKEFKDLEKEYDVIHVFINSPGGSIYEGMPIYNVLKNSSKIIYTYVDGMAASMGALIALAGKKIFGYRNSIFMVHNASNYAYGNAEDLKTASEELNTYDKALGTILEDRLNISETEVSEKYLNFKDNYFTGDEALALGFFDEIIKKDASTSTEDLKNMSHQNLMNHYSKMNFTEQNNTNANTNPMNKEIIAPSIQNALGYETPFTATDEGVFLQESEVDALEATLTAANTTATGLQAEIDGINALSTGANSVIDAALENAEIEFTPEMSISDKITLLNDQRNEFAGKTAKKTTKVVDDNAADKVIANEVGGYDITAAMNN